MNLNSELLALKDLLKCPVVQDLYTDQGTRFATFTYDLEEPELCGDNDVLIEKATIQISYYFPLSYNYFADKEAIKAYLHGLDYIVEYIQVFVDEEDIKDSIQLRRMLITAQKAA